MTTKRRYVPKSGKPPVVGNERERRGIFKSGVQEPIAVVEIGSRAARLLVACDAGNGELRIVQTRAADTFLMESDSKGDAAISSELANISKIVMQFREQARKSGAVHCVVFATEAIRQVAARDVYLSSPLAAAIDEILDERAEAECSLVAGVMGLRAGKVRGDTAFVLDQGAGSTELSVGEVGPPTKLVDFVSLKCGGNNLLKIFRDHRLNVKSFSAEIVPVFERCRLPADKADNVVMMGTVATKCAWLTKRRDIREKYDPRRVHGQKIMTEALSLLVSFGEKCSAKQWKDFQEIVNPGETGGDAAERLVSGAISLLHLLKRLNKEQFIVSAYGTRHGMIMRTIEQIMAQSPPYV